MPNLTARDVEYELEKLHYDLFLEETEDNWEKITKSVNALNSICVDGGYEVASSEVANALRSSHRPIVSAMNSERTRLSGCALDLMGSVAAALGKDFEQMLPLFMPPLLALCGRTNKVVFNRARGAIFIIIEVAQLASVLPYFLQNIKDKSATLRLVIAEGTLACLNSCNPPDLEKEARAKEIEAIIRGTARDANADVRKVSRKIFESYKILLPSRVESFTAPLSPTMKKYLDIKSNTITSQKSTSNLRSNLNLKPEIKLSSSTTTRPNGHARSASSSTVYTGTTSTQAKNLATSLTRVSRKVPPTAPSAPVRPVQPSRVVTETHNETHKSEAQTAAPSNGGPSRATAPQETKRPVPPLRSQRSIISRSTAASTALSASSTAPRRLQLNPNPPAAIAAHSAGLASSGPRRVPMPPPPPPAPKKEDGPKRPASRVDNAASNATTTSRTTATLPGPTKKPASSTSSNLKDRTQNKPPAPKFKPTSSTTSAGGAANGLATEAKSTTTKTVSKPPIPKYRPTPAAATDAGLGSSSTKPLAIAKSKPVWGSGPPASQKGAAPAKTVVKKASTRSIIKPAAAGATKNIRRPVTPAMVALPPSPTPEEEEEKPAPAEEEVNTAEKDEATVEQVEKRVSPPVSPTPESVVVVDDGEVPEQVSEDNDVINTKTATETVDSASTTLTDDNSTATASTVTEHAQTTFGSFRNGTSSASLAAHGDHPPMRLPTSNADLGLPHTPMNNFLLPNPPNPTFATKTPISALLSSIEQGFLYSPTTPLSPADAYMPGPNGTPAPYCHQRDAPRVEGPMQPFNYALHQHGGVAFGGIFGANKEAELVRGDIGVVNVNMNDQKMFVPVALPRLDERLAFVELTQ